LSGADLDALGAAIRRARRKGSYYWLFRHAQDLDLSARHELEVRIDLPVGAVIANASALGWRLAHHDRARGMLFIRREQPLTDAALRDMFAEVLAFASEHGGKFHSWMHKPDLQDW
jgi:hypothetical protein